MQTCGGSTPLAFLSPLLLLPIQVGASSFWGLEDPEKASDRNRILGTSENPDNISEFLKLVDKEIDPPISISHFAVPATNKMGLADNLLFVTVEKSGDVHSLKKGDTFLRKGRQNVKITAGEIIRLKYEKGALKFESEKTKN